jgi:hypothetical protein
MGEKMAVQWDGMLGIYQRQESLWLWKAIVYNIFIEFAILMNLNGWIKTCLNEIYGKVHIGKNLSDAFPHQNSQTDEMVCFHCFWALL